MQRLESLQIYSQSEDSPDLVTSCLICVKHQPPAIQQYYSVSMCWKTLSYSWLSVPQGLLFWDREKLLVWGCQPVCFSFWCLPVFFAGVRISLHVGLHSFPAAHEHTHAWACLHSVQAAQLSTSLGSISIRNVAILKLVATFVQTSRLNLKIRGFTVGKRFASSSDTCPGFKMSGFIRIFSRGRKMTPWKMWAFRRNLWTHAMIKQNTEINLFPQCVREGQRKDTSGLGYNRMLKINGLWELKRQQEDEAAMKAEFNFELVYR